jgi:hypothetical protein
MTINADFFKLVKEGCAHAFSDEPPVRPDVVFIDGQVKLMKAAQIDLWSVFFQVQFFKTIENSFNLGASTVVLAFDDYNHVPASKTMTQVKRAKQKIVLPFAQTACLPAKMPEDWAGAMANRTFKVKVILKILETTSVWFEKKLATDAAYRERNLVLDYAGVPQLLRLQCSTSALNNIECFIKHHDWTPRQNVVGRGECDIKAFVWMHVSKCLCILSTDGDYLPLALLQTCNKECDVLLFRIKTQIPESASTKRKIADCQQQHSTIHDQHKNSRRAYEYVRIAPIACWIKETLPSKAVEPVRQFCAMVALCGCDFARNLPRVGPRTLWKMRHRLQHIDLLQPPQIVSALAIGYTELFVMKNGLPAGMRNNTEWFQDAGDDQVCLIYSNVAARIQANNKVCQRIKSQLWDADIAIAHARNTVWTLHYWSFLDNCPDPHAENFGYVKDGKGRTHFAGSIAESMT